MIQMNKNRNRLTDTENRLMFATGERVEGRMEWEVGFSRCKLLYIEWINKVLLYSTKNYIQYTMINHNSKGYCKNVYTHTHTHTHILGWPKNSFGFFQKMLQNERTFWPTLYIYISESLCYTAEISMAL